jgi:hypothetical protein
MQDAQSVWQFASQGKPSGSGENFHLLSPSSFILKTAPATSSGQKEARNRFFPDQAQ